MNKTAVIDFDAKKAKELAFEKLLEKVGEEQILLLNDLLEKIVKMADEGRFLVSINLEGLGKSRTFIEISLGLLGYKVELASFFSSEKLMVISWN